MSVVSCSTFKRGVKRLLVSTDLIGRGIDIEGVNVVFNYDMPETDIKHGNGADTYLHRVSKCLSKNTVMIRVPAILQVMLSR